MSVYGRVDGAAAVHVPMTGCSSAPEEGTSWTGLGGLTPRDMGHRKTLDSDSGVMGTEARTVGSKGKMPAKGRRAPPPRWNRI